MKGHAMLKYELNDRVGRIVVERQDASNAFTGAMVRELGDIVTKAAQEADILVLTGAGPDFTLGRDRQEKPGGTPFDAFGAISALNQAAAAFPGIFITGVRGRAFGLGVGLVMRSDIAIAAGDAKFALDEVSLGIAPMFIMEEIIEHLPPKQALDVVLTSRVFGADEALQMGLLTKVVPAAQLDTAVDDYVRLVRKRDRETILTCKLNFRALRNMPAATRPAFVLVEQTRFAMRKH
jgi:enoyl-CoA hydratase/carnithine racemase